MTYIMDFYDAEPTEVEATLSELGATNVAISAQEENLFSVLFDTRSMTKLRAKLMESRFADRWTEYRKVML